jgi:hypothetical protein
MMQKIYAKEINYASAVGEFELYLASEVDTQVAELKALLGRHAEWLNAYMHDRESHDEAAKLLAESSQYRPAQGKGDGQ